MSSWVHDWERALIPKVHGVKAKARTQCKLGRHLVLESVAMVWLRGPMGLSCFPCAEEHGHLEEVAAERARTAAPKPRTLTAEERKARQGRKIPESEWVHGEPATYKNQGCRCTPCRQANSRASAEYRAKRRAAQELEGAAA